MGTRKPNIDAPTEKPPDAKYAMVRLTCVGTAPVMPNRMTDAVKQYLRTKQRMPKSPDTKPEDVAKGALYRGPNGEIGFPVPNLFACLREAGRDVPLKTKQNISTATSTRLPALFQIRAKGFFIPITCNGTPPEKAWVVDEMQGRNPNGGEAVLIIRPRFDEWGFSVVGRVNLQRTTVETICHLFREAGEVMGLCDFRPGRRGLFGTFELVSHEILEYVAEDGRRIPIS